MSNFAVWKDVVYTANVQDLRYYVKADGETIYQGRAKADPSGTVRINVREIVKDWLDSNIRDYLPMSPDFVAHPEALRVCGLYDAETDVLLAEYNVLFNFDTDWNGEDLLLQNPVNTHADPRQKIFAGYGTIDPDGADVDITVRDLYWFDAQDNVVVTWNTTEVHVPVSTNYDPWDIEVILPAGVTLVSRSQHEFVFRVPENEDTEHNATYTVEYRLGGRTLDQTQITLLANGDYFWCTPALSVDAEGGNLNIDILTGYDLSRLTAVPSSGLSMVSFTTSLAVVQVPYNSLHNSVTHTVSFYLDGTTLVGTCTITQAMDEWFVAPQFLWMDYAGGQLVIPIDTSYDMTQVAVVLPPDVTLVSKTQNAVTVLVPGNNKDTAFDDYTITYRKNGVLLGTTQVRVAGLLFDDYLTVVPYDNKVTLQIANTGDSSFSRTIEYSVSGGAWQSRTLVGRNDSYDITGLTPSDTVRLRGNHDRWRFFSVQNISRTWGNILSLVYGSGYKTADGDLSGYNWGTFTTIFGNNPYLVDASALYLSAKKLSQGCYQALFENCTALTGAPMIPSPTTAIGTSYYNMFNGCTALVNPPANIPAVLATADCYEMFRGCTSLVKTPYFLCTGTADYCYQYMFYGCTSLRKSEELRATTLSIGCYQGMFAHCTSLEVAPVLPARTANYQTAADCYGNLGGGYIDNGMFQGCTSLRYIKCLLDPHSESYPGPAYTQFWVQGVAPTGTFVKARGIDWSFLESYTGCGIPAGWTVQEV